MGRDIITVDVGNLSGSIRSFCNAIMSNATGKIRDELFEEAQSGVNNFYADYSPSSYHRHYYNLMSNAFEKYYAHAGDRWYGGIRLTPGSMDDIYYKNSHPVSGSEVFHTAFEQGWHGPPEYTPVPPMGQPPKEQVERKRDEIVANIQSYIDGASSGVSFG